MSAWTLVPTCNDPMSEYTLLAFILLVVGISALYGMTRHQVNEKFNDQLVENARIDMYIETANAYSQLMGNKLAVLEERVGNIQSTCVDIKQNASSYNINVMEALKK